MIKATKIIFNSINNGISVLACTYGEAAFKELNDSYGPNKSGPLQ